MKMTPFRLLLVRGAIKPQQLNQLTMCNCSAKIDLVNQWNTGPLLYSAWASAQPEPSEFDPADAQALDDISVTVSSITIVLVLGVAFLLAGFGATVVEGGVVEGEGVVVELGVPTSVGVLAGLVVVSSLSLRVAFTAQTMPAIKITKAIINANLTVLDILAVYPPPDRNQETQFISWQKVFSLKRFCATPRK